MFLKILQNSQQNICARVPFLKRDSGADVFLSNLRNFQEQLFLQNTSDDCFCEGKEAAAHNGKTSFTKNLEK